MPHKHLCSKFGNRHLSPTGKKCKMESESYSDSDTDCNVMPHSGVPVSKKILKK